MSFPKNDEILPGCVRQNDETNPTRIISFGVPQLEIKFEHAAVLA
jgi:hypothetical protein